MVLNVAHMVPFFSFKRNKRLGSLTFFSKVREPSEMKMFESASHILPHIDSHIFNRCYENVKVRNKVKLQGPEKV